MIDLKLGDCLDHMKNIPDGSVDLILADLPYGTTASNWDSIINFEIMWKEYERVITDQGAIVLFSSGRFTNKLVDSNSELYRYKWIWLKSRTGNFVNAKNRPLTSYEEICVFSKGITANTKHLERKMNYYPQGLIEKKKQWTKAGNNKFGSMHGTRPGHKKVYKTQYTNYPKDVLNFKCVNKFQHPNQKPIELLEYLIKTYSKVDDTVLDNVMGSGSTGVACVNTGRNFIGIELDEAYFKIAESRINSVNDESRAA